MRRLQVVVLVALVALMGACKSTKLVSDSTTKTTTEETIETKRNLGIKLPGWDLGLSGNIGSRIVFVPVPGKPGEEEPCIVIKPNTFIITGKDSINALQLQIDSLGNFVAKASQREHELQVEIIEKTRIIKQQSETIKKYVEKDSWLKGFFNKIIYVVIAIVVILGIIFYFFNKFRPSIL